MESLVIFSVNFKDGNVFHQKKKKKKGGKVCSFFLMFCLGESMVTGKPTYKFGH